MNRRRETTVSMPGAHRVSPIPALPMIVRLVDRNMRANKKVNNGGRYKDAMIGKLFIDGKKEKRKSKVKLSRITALNDHSTYLPRNSDF